MWYSNLDMDGAKVQVAAHAFVMSSLDYGNMKKVFYKYLSVCGFCFK